MIARGLDHGADLAADPGLGGIAAQKREAPAARLQQIETEAEESAFARAIGAQNAIDAAFGDGKRQAVQRRDRAEPLGQIMRLDQRGQSSPRRCSIWLRKSTSWRNRGSSSINASMRRQACSTVV